MKFSEKVRASRRALNLSQTELANLTGVSLSAIQLYEMGRRFPRKDTMTSLSRALGVSVRYLSDEDCDDSKAGSGEPETIDIEKYRKSKRKQHEVESVIRSSIALFSDDYLTNEQKYSYLNELVRAYNAFVGNCTVDKSVAADNVNIQRMKGVRKW